MSRARSRQRRRFVGLVPRVGQRVWAALRWFARHPQPMLLAAAVGLGAWALWSYGERSDAFRVTQVHLPPESSLKLKAPLIGEYLWTLDIRALADELSRQQPWLKEVRVVRQLPSTIRIEAIPRVPVAQVRLDLPASRQAGRWYPIDQSGFILPQASGEPAPNLVRLEGLERGGGVRVGKDNAQEPVQLALRVLARLRRAPPSIARRLVAVNVSDPHEIRFLLDLSATPLSLFFLATTAQTGATPSEAATEVRCGSEAEFDAHLQRLQAALKAMAKESLAVRYIDVRFREPVVGPRA